MNNYSVVDISVAGFEKGFVFFHSGCRSPPTTRVYLVFPGFILAGRAASLGVRSILREELPTSPR